MKFRWQPAPAQPLLAGQLANQLNIPPLLAQCLLNRDLSDPASLRGFLQPRLRQLADPFELPDMAAAVERLAGQSRREVAQLAVDAEARPHFDVLAGDAGVEAVERPHGRPAHPAAEQVIHAAVARADEALGGVHPANRAADVRAAA